MVSGKLIVNQTNCEAGTSASFFQYSLPLPLSLSPFVYAICRSLYTVICNLLIQRLDIYHLKQPCNPAVGGPAKSQLVHEVDALGGEIGKIADR